VRRHSDRGSVKLVVNYSTVVRPAGSRSDIMYLRYTRYSLGLLGSVWATCVLVSGQYSRRVAHRSVTTVVLPRSMGQIDTADGAEQKRDGLPLPTLLY